MADVLRRLLNVFTALSVLPCIAVAVLDQAVSFTTSKGVTYSVAAPPHRLELKRIVGLPPKWVPDLAGWRVKWSPRVVQLRDGPPLVSRWERAGRGALGCGWESRAGRAPGVQVARMVVPFWSLAAITLAPASLVVRGALRRRCRKR
jgi:hypothetical protein